MSEPKQTQSNRQSNRQPDGPVRGRGGRRADGPVIPDRAASDTDAAWGDSGGARSDEWYESERPPHHGDV